MMTRSIKRLETTLDCRPRLEPLPIELALILLLSPIVTPGAILFSVTPWAFKAYHKTTKGTCQFPHMEQSEKRQGDKPPD